MKRLILLTLLTLIGWIGATNTLRAEKYGKLFGVDITDENCHDLVKAVNDYAYKYSIKFFEASGKLSYDHSTHTLTMENLTLSCKLSGLDGIAIRPNDEINKSQLKIEVIGTNTVNCKTALITYGEGMGKGTLDIKGPGTLTVNCEDGYYCATVEMRAGAHLDVHCKELCINVKNNAGIGTHRQPSPSTVSVHEGAFLKITSANTHSDIGAFTNVDNLRINANSKIHKPASGQFNYSKKTVTDGVGNLAKEVIIAPKSWMSDEDDTPPTAKGDLTATPTDKTIALSWKRASDNKTLPGNLRYQVRWKRTSDKSWKYSHSEDKMPKDMTSYTIEDLTPKTKYDVDVKVCDGAGNASYYGKKTVQTKETTPELVLKDKTLTVTGKTDHSVSLQWHAATYGTRPHSEIKYSIVYRLKGEETWKHSTLLYGETEHTVTGLMADTEYEFWVLVFHKSMDITLVYTDKAEARTDKLVDKTPPTFPEGARVKVDEVTETTVKISWPKATDDRTPQNKIRYTIYKNWKYNYSIGIDVDSHTFDLLAQDTKYKFQVYAIDEVGNWSKSLDTIIKTKKKVVPDTEPPYFPNGQELSVTATETSLNVSWPAAADKVTATNDLRYTFFFSRSDASYWPGNTLGKNALSHTVTGLQPDTEYNICVTVYDEAANSADYTWKLKTKTKASDKTVHPASVSIAPTSLDLETENKATLTATVLPADAKDKTVTWSSNLPAIASVDAVTGEVTALAPGKAEITATANDKADGTKSETIEVRVKAKKVRKLVTDVSVMPAVHTMVEGDIFYYSGIVEPDDADEKALTWTSSDPTVATVSKGGGFINALKAGTTTITATANDGSGKYGQSTLTVKTPILVIAATGIVVDQTDISLYEGGTATLTARVLPADAASKGFTWSSSDPTVASVSSDGVVTAHLPGGTALITATADDGGWTDFCTVRVKGTSVKITPSAFRLGLGESLELTATTEPWDSPMTKSWSTNRPGVAEVNKDGKVKAVAEGDAVITVTLSGGQKANCYITVKKGGEGNANELIVDDSNSRVWAADGILYVSTEQLIDVEVFNFSGLLLKKFKASTGTTPVEHLPAGFYAVRIGQQTTKVVIR